MVNPEKIKSEILVLRDWIKKIFVELTAVDKERLDSLENFISSKELDGILQFESLTRKSSSLLGEFEKSFLKITAYVILVKKEGHKDSMFQELFRKYKLLDKFIKKMQKENNRQVKISSLLIRVSSGGNVMFPGRLLRKLRSSISKEKDFKLFISGIYKVDREKLDMIKRYLDNEKIKLGSVVTAAGALWLAPFVGTILFVGIIGAYSWANKYSENYKRLIDLVK